jgi:hypothetical protein
MDTRKTNLTTYALLAIALAAVGCSDDSERAPSGPSFNLDGGIQPAPLDSGTTGPVVPGTGAPDSGPTPVADGGTTPVTTTPTATNCFQGKATSNEQLLNACAEGCQKFDNLKRLPAGYAPGKLPPL